MSAWRLPRGPSSVLPAREGSVALPCRQEDGDMWFSELPAKLERAKRLCGLCPIRHDCLAAALARAEPWGVWGGEILQAGAVIPYKRARGRPPKNSAAA